MLRKKVSDRWFMKARSCDGVTWLCYFQKQTAKAGGLLTYAMFFVDIFSFEMT